MLGKSEHLAEVDWASMPEWITVEEASKLSGYHPDHLRRIIRQGRIAAEKKGLMWWVDRDSLNAYLTRIQELGTKKHHPQGIAVHSGAGTGAD